MTLRELLYRVEGELTERPENCDQRVVFVTARGSVFEASQACPTSDGDLLIIDIQEAEDLR